MSETMTATEARRRRAAEAHAAAKRAVPTSRDLPPERLAGLADPRNEHDSCGVGFIADLKGNRSHEIIEKGLQILQNLTHRGAVGSDPLVGDGAGILVQIPHAFLSEECAALGFSLPEPGHYGVGYLFMPREEARRRHYEEIVAQVIKEEGQRLLGWRSVPVDNSSLSQDPKIKASEPVHRQVFIGRGATTGAGDAFERRLFILRKVISNVIHEETRGQESGFYIVSMSARTLVYKGMFLAYQLAAYYSDLHDPRFASQMALVHQRFSTNTFPSWKLAHPYRMVAHNGEINTLRGNVNWMAARQASVSSPLFSDEITKLWPISYEGQSDTACFDNALEFLTMGGYELAHAAMMLIPEAWAGNPLMDEERRAFYEYHAALMEPWDGPAAIAFTDGRQIGATLDRNGLRPARYVVTDDGLVIMASEVGVLPIPPEKIVTKWRLQPGKMLLIDLEEGRIIADDELKRRLATANPYRHWLAKTQIVLEDLPETGARAAATNASLLDRQQAFGYTQEDLKVLMAPMATTGQEAVGSMGTDTPVAVLSRKPKLLYNYFKQNFAQVTNPAIDPIREEAVMSLVSFIGPRPNLFDLKGASERKRLEVRQPILTNEDLEKIRMIGEIADNHFQTKTLDITFAVDRGVEGMELAVTRLCDRAEQAVLDGYNIIILSDRLVGAGRVAIPALLATAAVHNYLIRKGLRTSVGLVVETGEAREVHQFCVLAGYGAESINPYLAFETLLAMHAEGAFPEVVDADEIIYRYIKSIGKGVLKVMSKMGISTYQSYCGAQIFDSVGLSSGFVHRFFFGTSTTIEGIGLGEIAEETLRRHRAAFGEDPVLRLALDVGGEYAWRVRGEDHMWTPDAIALLQHAVRGKGVETYRQYADLLNGQVQRNFAIRGLFRIKSAEELGRQPVPIDEVEPAAEIVKRFSTGAMSFGSISREAHETLAIAMNRIGGKSNTGEGGEESERFRRLANGDSKRSAIKQVASGRFGVTTEYLVNSDMMQIKIAQGAKPGEGGQLPGHKVDATIAKVRHSTPGVGLISPPPHHDIYSIEDLAQLIHDLKNVATEASISVKLVSEVGVGTIAAGVAKCKADHVVIAGHDGGTGASPWSSIKHAGSPWEIGLAETQQTLVLNRLRGRIRVQADGQMKTGRDVVIGALLGADEFGFATAPLVVEGCIMMRKCHLNTCPVGVATQDPVLRRKFEGKPEHVVNYFFFVAEEVRQIMAQLGIRKFDELVGRADLLDMKKGLAHWKARGLDFSRLFAQPKVPAEVPRFHCEEQDHKLEKSLDKVLIEKSRAAIERGEKVQFMEVARNVNRSVGAMLSGALTRLHPEGLPDDTLRIQLEGTGGQSFGAFLARGITLYLIGDANDYTGKGLSGGRVVVRPSIDFRGEATKNIIIGNTALYGATSGEAFFSGVAGERFAVRLSGATAVVEGTGDHGCEYMTGGTVAVLGKTGRNFAAGMSGGIAYVYDEDGKFATRCNTAMVSLERVGSTAEQQAAAGGTKLHRDQSDEALLKKLLEEHNRWTGSRRARDLLDNWAESRMKFVKVFPNEYKRALAEMHEREVELASVGNDAHAAMKQEPVPAK